MPRPVKKMQKNLSFPQCLEFLPADDTEKKTPIVLTVDEYETIPSFGQERLQSGAVCSIMQNRRTTVQRIYEIARKRSQMHIDRHHSKLRAEISRICDSQAAAAALEDITMKFTKNMQQKKEKVS